MAQYLLYNDVTVGTPQGAILYRTGRIVDTALSGISVATLRAAGADLRLIRTAPNVSGIEAVDGTGLENYYARLQALDSSALECLRVSVPADSQLDFQIVVNAKGPNSVDNGEWKFALTYVRNGSGAAALQQAAADPISKTGSATNAPPVGWDAVVALSGNDVVVSVTSVAGVKIQVSATAFQTKPPS